ncbi:hypothetical protein [Spirosoma arcticum]
MKNLIICVLMLTALPCVACDICGCGNGSSFFGILPQSHRGFVGVRYGYKSYASHLTSVNLRSEETFQKAELWGRFYPMRKLQVLAFVPYFVNRQTLLETGDQKTLSGLGDASVLVNYNVLNTFMDSTIHQIDHSLLLGGGVKLPTGRYRYDPLSDADVANANFQLGTGSVDVLVNAVYTVRYRQWGINTDATYKMNGANSNRYQFGNRTTVNASVLYFGQLGGVTLVPNAGVAYENARRDRDLGVLNTRTGGYTTFATAGIEGYIRNVSMGVNYQKPVTQNLSNGELRANSRLNLHVTLLI